MTDLRVFAVLFDRRVFEVRVLSRIVVEYTLGFYRVAHSRTKALDAIAEVGTQCSKTLGAEDVEHNDQHDQQLWPANA